MNIKEFFESSRTCPVCQKTLTLYLQVGTAALMQARPIHKDTFEVHTILGKNPNTKNLFENKVIKLVNSNDHFMKIRVPENHVGMDYLDEDFHLFYLCNADALNFTKYSGDYVVESGKACHFRSSHSFRMSQPDHNGLRNIYPNELTESIEGTPTLFKYESYALRDFKEDQEMTKVYVVKLDHHKKETHFHYYTFNKEQAKDKGFRPNIFSKTFDVVRDKLDYSSENRDKLLHKLDSWLLIS